MTPLKMMLTGTTHISRGGICYDSIEEAIKIIVIVVIAATIGYIVGPMLGIGAGTAAWYAGSTVATMMLTESLMPVPDLPTMDTNSSSRLASTRDAAAPHEYVYGTVRKGGTITFIESTGTDNTYLHMVICLAGHEVDSIPSIYIDDQIVTLDGSGYVTSAPWNSKVRIIKHLGSPTQAADSSLVGETSVDSSFRGQGIAYLYMRLEYDQDVFVNGIPQVSAVVKGKKVYDPATTTTAWSDNPALCIRDYVTSEYGLNDVNIDETSFTVAKNICNEDVDLSVGGVQNRYTLNGVINANNSIGSSIQKMMSSCTGVLFWAQGSWQLKAGSYTAPIKDFTLDDLRSGISIQTRANIRDNLNVVTGTFIDVGQDYITAEYPQIKSTIFIAQDGGEENPLDLALPFTNNSAMAQRIAKQTLFRGREQIVFNAEFGMNAFGIQAGDVVTMTNSRYGWEQKDFEVASWRFVVSEEGGDLRIALTLAETSSTVYDWDAEEQDIISNDSTLPNFRDVGTVGVAINAELRIVNQAVVGILQVDLTSSNPFASQFEVQFKKSSDSTWISLGVSSNVRFEAISIEDGNYDVRARAISTLGVRGAWNTVPSWYVSIFAPPPANVTGFVGNVVGSTLHLTWEPVADLDLSHYKIRYSSLTSGATYSNAVDIVDKVARPANSVTVPAQTGTYFIKAVDKIGGLSVTATSFAVLVDSNNVEDFNAIVTLTEDPTFAGTRDNVVVLTDETGDYLALDTLNKFDELAGDFDDALGLFDGGAGDIVPSGTYQFFNSIDLGDKYTSRVYPTFNVDYLDYVNDFDGASGLFDSRAGQFDGDPDQFDTTSAKLQVRYTDDDPAGTPTWSAWQSFIVGDISARAMQFRVLMTSSGGTATPAVRALAAQIDMPERVQAQSDIAFTGTTNITFPSAFKDTPAIGIALANLADGERYTITSKSRTGFTITIYDGLSVSTNSVDLDYVAKGYGKELTI
jgi:hypothetical protein